MKTLILVLGLILVFILSGCIDQKSTTLGTYTFKNNSITLYESNTYMLVFESGFKQSGGFTIEKDEVHVVNILGMTYIFKIVQDGLIDNDGNLWPRLVIGKTQ